MSSERRLPQFIHIGRKSAEQKANAAHPPPSTPPPNTLYKTPTKARGSNNNHNAVTPPTSNSRHRRIRGILKSPSYRFSGIRVKSSPKKSKQLPSTPTTVGTNESLDEENCNFDCNDSIGRSSIQSGSTMGSVSTFGTTSTEGIKNAIEKIISKDQTTSPKPKAKASDDETVNNNNSSSDHKGTLASSSSASVSSASTTSTTVSTTSATSKEELQRCARLKHIEDLKERISDAKARKLVERRAYRREDKLLLRLARQLKAVSKLSRENALNITILEESNQFCEECYNQALAELEELRASRISLQESLLAENQSKLEEDREQRNRIIRVQNAELEAHKRSHQFNCQALCESVLDANNDLDRMRALWEEHFGGPSGKGRKKRRSKGSRLSMLVAMVVVFAITTFIIRATTTYEGPLDKSYLQVEEQQQYEEKYRSLPPLHMIPKGIIRDEETDIGSKKTAATNEEITTTKKNEATWTMGKAENGLSSPEPSKNTVNLIVDGSHHDGDSSIPEASSNSSMVETASMKHGGKGKRRFRPKEVISNIFRK